MVIEVRVRGFSASRFLQTFATRKVREALLSSSDKINRVVVRITDVNGPKGGVDKRCQLVAHGPGLRHLTVQSADDDPFAAVAKAVKRCVRSLRRRTERQTPRVSPA